MSKIQKALGILRNDGDKSVADERSAAPLEGDTKDDRRQTSAQSNERHSSALRSRRRYIAEDVVVNEQAPAFSIAVDVEELKSQGLHPQDDDVALVAQEFRRIKRPVLNTAFTMAGADEAHANVIMMASALPKSGKTFCSINLAMSIARERDVGAVIVDADVLKPNISRAFGLEKRVGLIDYLLDSSVTLDEILVGTDLSDIVLVPAGRQHEEATELLASRRMQELIDELSKRYYARAIIVDTPPLLLTNEAHVLAENMGQIVMVVEAGQSSQESTIQALSSLDRSKPINAILNKARYASFGSYYGGGEYGYYSAAGKGQGYGKQE
jgi:exopolysaccharide/PEP-CTERM locus tyrosine autokinase